MSNDFNRFEYAMADIDINRSVFDLSHSLKTSFNVGSCIPIANFEVLPGDTWSVDTTKVIRVQPLVAPVMDNLYLDTYYFFVPNRLIWDHWINFMGENTQSAWHDETEYQVPQIIIPEGGFASGTIADYLGVPINVGAGKEISALPFRAYSAVMNDWFIDKNLQNPVFVYKGDNNVVGDNNSSQSNCYKGGTPFIASKYKDYFTTCLPDAQRGDPATLPLSGPSKIQFKEAYRGVYPVAAGGNDWFDIYGVDHFIDGVDTLHLGRVNGNNITKPTSSYDLISKSNSGDWSSVVGNGSAVTPSSTTFNYTPVNLYADLHSLPATLEALPSETAMISVNELRQAFAIQRYLERSARSGSRYIESIEAFFGVTSPDARMQRTEYLGGSRLPLQINDVTVTSSSESAILPTAGVAGKSLTGETNSDFTKSFTEHGYIIGIAVVRYKHTYQNGLDKHWLRKTLYEYYNPCFANLGEMPVRNAQIFFGTDADYETFGFQEAWAEYRYMNNRVSGEMRSNHANSLDMWHFADDYDSLPALSDTWIREDKSSLDRALAVTSSVSNQLIGDFYFDISVARPMPLYSIPGLIDHN